MLGAALSMEMTTCSEAASRTEAAAGAVCVAAPRAGVTRGEDTIIAEARAARLV